MEYQLENKCQFYQISRDQRKTETDRGENHDGTMGYENTGCYKCDGATPYCGKKR